ncbi:MAG: prolyl oligopeptidase family serine peptidase [Gemmatimonadota bacterium]
MTLRSRALASGLLALLLAPWLPVRAQKGTRSPSVDDLLSLRSAGSVQLAPDGRRVAWIETSTDWQRDQYTGQLWLVDSVGGTPRQLTRHEQGVSQPQWSPDGAWIGFVSTRVAGRPQLFVMAVQGGEPLQLTNHPTGVQSWQWSPTGAQVAFAATEADSTRTARDSSYGAFEVVRRDYAWPQLFTITVADALRSPQRGMARTHGTSRAVSGFEWSPDGTRIAFSATRAPDLALGATSDVYVLHLANDSIHAVVQRPGADNTPIWSPDGTRLAFTSAMGDGRTAARNLRLVTVNADGGAVSLAPLTFDENVQPIAWTTDGLWFAAQQRTASHLYRTDMRTGALTRITQPMAGIYAGFSMDRGHTRVAFVVSSADALPEVGVSDVATFTPRVITGLSQQVTTWKLGRREVIHWKSKDGNEIEGILITPREFDPAKKYPLLCVIHGGPTGVDRPTLPDARYYPIDEWVNRGAVVLKVNYRGSAAYGERFRTLNVRNLGVGDAWDVESGVQHLVTQGIVDPARVATMGWSQGGYISAFLTTTSTMFKAVSVGAGISDWRTYYYNTDITSFTINYLGADPVTDPAIYAKTSPVDYAKTARTPTLIQHGELDRRVPPANAYQLRQVLEDRGVPVELVVYKGFGHGITKPRAQRAVMQHNLVWFNHHLWGDPLPDLTRVIAR